MESELKKELKKLFPLRVSSERIYLGMGEYGFRCKLSTQDGDRICYSDYEPDMINEINLIVGAAIDTVE
jgi:hypothetical protein